MVSLKHSKQLKWDSEDEGLESWLPLVHSPPRRERVLEIWIPDDVLSLILQFLVEEVRNTTNAPHERPVPIIVAGVCRQWRALCISTPSLWTDIAIRPYGGKNGGRNIAANKAKLCDLFVSRSGMRPLKIKVETWMESTSFNESSPRRVKLYPDYVSSRRWKEVQALIDTIASSAERWHTLDLKCHWRIIRQLFRALPPRSTPMLEKLIIEIDEFPEGITQTLAHFATASTLRSVSFNDCAQQYPIDLPWEQLHSLKVQFYNRLQFQRFFGNLTLPSLVNLQIIPCDDRGTDVWWQPTFSQLLDQSSMKLRRLVLDLNVLNQQDLLAALGSAPSLAELELVVPCSGSNQWSHSVFSVQMLQHLTLESIHHKSSLASQDLLPNLQILSLIVAIHWFPPTMQALISMLESRTTSRSDSFGTTGLQSFHLQLNAPVESSEPIERLADELFIEDVARHLRSELVHCSKLYTCIVMESWNSVAFPVPV
ncbi:hypothetical protein HWV62_9891 [Athelia sp. TMB]|nr:hypothetical protein HWV62_9891 [Athelia sp. TMB]